MCKLHIFNHRAIGPMACETRFVLYEVQTTAVNAAICGDFFAAELKRIC